MKSFNDFYILQKLNLYIWLLIYVIFVSSHLGLTLKSDHCEVCTTAIDRFSDSLLSEEKTDVKKIEMKFKEFCKTTKSKENRFCYYLGGLEDSATGILSEMSKPFSWGMPSNKICEKLKKKDAQICELRYDKQIDLGNVDLKTLKVRDLKKILNDWDESCNDCIEKGDFVKRIEHLKPKYTKVEL